MLINIHHIFYLKKKTVCHLWLVSRILKSIWFRDANFILFVVQRIIIFATTLTFFFFLEVEGIWSIIGDQSNYNMNIYRFVFFLMGSMQCPGHRWSMVVVVAKRAPSAIYFGRSRTTPSPSRSQHVVVFRWKPISPQKLIAAPIELGGGVSVSLAHMLSHIPWPHAPHLSYSPLSYRKVTQRADTVVLWLVCLLNQKFRPSTLAPPPPPSLRAICAKRDAESREVEWIITTV